jgi:hypothetical protein
LKIILPKILARVESAPVFYLIGPVLGGDDWQYRACLELQKQMNEEFFVAVPPRYGPNHPLYQLRAEGEEHFSGQLPWERYYINQAGGHAKRGAIIVWLPTESETAPRPREYGPYAQDTYGELGEFRGQMLSGKKLRIAVGADAKFPGLSTILRNFHYALDYELGVHHTIEDTVSHGIGIAGV